MAIPLPLARAVELCAVEGSGALGAHRPEFWGISRRPREAMRSFRNGGASKCLRVADNATKLGASNRTENTRSFQKSVVTHFGAIDLKEPWRFSRVLLGEARGGLKERGDASRSLETRKFRNLSKGARRRGIEE